LQAVVQRRVEVVDAAGDDHRGTAVGVAGVEREVGGGEERQGPVRHRQGHLLGLAVVEGGEAVHVADLDDVAVGGPAHERGGQDAVFVHALRGGRPGGGGRVVDRDDVQVDGLRGGLGAGGAGVAAVVDRDGQEVGGVGAGGDHVIVVVVRLGGVLQAV